MPASVALDDFKGAFSGIVEVPYWSGILPLDEKTSKLFYRTEGERSVQGMVDFAKASESDLKALTEACQPATFGIEKKDVVDDTHLRAGTLDATEFATNISPATAGIVDIIREVLLQEVYPKKSIQVEICKLNIYGPGSFFKAHVDTPRSDKMFGTLVIVLPTIHEGGSLIFRHAGEEHVFDTAKDVSPISKSFPRAAFVAFYSDVEHEISLVKSGYRVTITYNLYFANPQDIQPSAALGRDILYGEEEITHMKSTLEKLLADPEFLKDGGLLGFGLTHKYPFDADTTKLRHIDKLLKGSDAIVIRICKAVGLTVVLRTIYEEDDEDFDYCLANKFVSFNCMDEDASPCRHIRDEYGGTMVFNSPGNASARKFKDDDSDSENDSDSDNDSDSGNDSDPVALPIVWMKSLETSNKFSAPACGDRCRGEVYRIYGDICLVAKIRKAGDRNAA